MSHPSAVSWPIPIPDQFLLIPFPSQVGFDKEDEERDLDGEFPTERNKRRVRLEPEDDDDEDSGEGGQRKVFNGDDEDASESGLENDDNNDQINNDKGTKNCTQD